MHKTVFWLLLITTGCNNTSTDKKINEKNSKTDTMQTYSTSLADIAIERDKLDTIQSALYTFKNDTLSQTLEVKYISKKEIGFKLITVNKAKNKTSTLIGAAAKGKSNQDSEMDEDDEGNAYTVTEYHYTKNDCSLSIRIDIDTKNRAKIIEYRCNNLHDIYSPFTSVGVLKKLQK